MIFFKAKPAATTPVRSRRQPATVESRKRVEEIASARRKKSDTDGTLRRQRQTVDDNRAAVSGAMALTFPNREPQLRRGRKAGSLRRL